MFEQQTSLSDQGTRTDCARQQERAKAGQGKGKLGRQLDAQRAQTHTDTLAAVSAENRAARDADAAAEARTWN